MPRPTLITPPASDALPRACSGPAPPTYSPLPRPHPCSTSTGQPSPLCRKAGLTWRLSSVAMPLASSQEYPVGRQSIYTRFFRQLPWENGFGGAGPSGTSVLCAVLRIYTRACTCNDAMCQNFWEGGSAGVSGYVRTEEHETSPPNPGPRHASRTR